MPERSTPDADLVGWIGDYDPVTQEFVYIAGVLTPPDVPVPEGYACRDIPDCEMSIVWIQGTHGPDLYASTYDLASQARKENGYEYDGSAGGFEMEYYSYERFFAPVDERGEKVRILDYYSPCKKKDWSV